MRHKNLKRRKTSQKESIQNKDSAVWNQTEVLDEPDSVNQSNSLPEELGVTQNSLDDEYSNGIAQFWKGSKEKKQCAKDDGRRATFGSAISELVQTNQNI